MQRWSFIIWLFAAGLLYIGGTFVVEYWNTKLLGRRRIIRPGKP
jgi:hypothetical protein